MADRRSWTPPWDRARRSLLAAAAVIAAALGWAAPATAQSGDRVLWYVGNDGYDDYGIAVAEAELLAAGASAVDWETVWPGALTDYRMVVLFVPSTAFDAGQLTDLQAFVDGGGLLLAVVEHANLAPASITTLNAVLASLGLGSNFVGANFGCGCGNAGTPVATHPFTDGVSLVRYSCSSNAVLGPDAEALIQGVAAEPLLAIEGNVLLATDGDLFNDACANVSENAPLFGNLFTAWCDMDGDGALKAICGGDDCDDDDPAAYPATWYADGDGDGFGDPGTGVDACPPPAGTVDDGTDCDDTRADAYPGAAELCNALDDDCDGAVPADEADDDGDGLAECGGDCDDADATVLPGAAEACNGIDDDCDGAVPADEADDDGDGVRVCGGDCDDADASAAPGLAEVTCDGVDNDCDAATEDAPDGDGDGASLCADCDDADAAVYPGAAETPCDGVDNDCDPGTADEPDGDLDGYSQCVDCDDADPYVNPAYPELQCDGVDNDCDAGTPDEPDGDGDGHSVCFDCDDADAAVYPGAAELLDELDNDCDGLFDEGLLASDALIVTEIMRNPDAVVDADGEWFELLNNTAHAINLVGLVGYDLGTDEFTVDVDAWIAPGEYAVLARVGDPAVNGGVTAVYEYDGMTLGNGTDELYLEHDGVLLDAVEFDNSDWPTESGASMQLDADHVDPVLNDDADFWCAAIDAWAGADLGSPGAANGLCCDDADGDGYDTCGDEQVEPDCDDADAAVFPGAAEACNGIDDDCDGLLLDDEVDADEDGQMVCEGDCDDDHAGTYDGAPELCDQLDNDCDGDVDEDADEDLDGDGLNACQGDCDNEDADVLPGAVEICDGKDDDCDGELPDDEADADGDGWMTCSGDCDDFNADRNLDDVDGDGWTSCDGDCNDTDSAVGLFDAEEACDDGLDNDCDGTVDDHDPDCVEEEPPPEEEYGCVCRDSVAGDRRASAAALLVALLAGAWLRRRPVA